MTRHRSRFARSRRAAAATASCALAVVWSSCLGSAGGESFDFHGYAAGPADAVEGMPYVFRSGRGFDVTLTRADLWIGAVYLNRSVSASGVTDTTCTLAGVYVAELTTGTLVDALSPKLQAFPEPGATTTERASTAEIWLSGGDIDAASDPTVILDLAGEATRGEERYPFEGRVTIGPNRKQPPSDPALPGAKPICKERIVSPIPIDLRAREGDALVLRVDPRGWFQNVDFAALEEVSAEPPLYRFRDDQEDQPSRNLFSGLQAGSGTYSLMWERDP